MKVIKFPDSRRAEDSGISSIVIRTSLIKMIAKLDEGGSRIFFTDSTHVDLSIDFEKAKLWIKN